MTEVATVLGSCYPGADFRVAIQGRVAITNRVVNTTVAARVPGTSREYFNRVAIATLP